MVRISLQTCNTNPHEILSKIGQNAYLLDVPLDWKNCLKFYIKNLMGCRGSLIASSDIFLEPISSDPSTFSSTPQKLIFLPNSLTRRYKVYYILDEQVILMRRGSTSGI